MADREYLLALVLLVLGGIAGCDSAPGPSTSVAPGTNIGTESADTLNPPGAEISRLYWDENNWTEATWQ